MPATDEIRARWGGFAWTADNEKQAKVIVGRYPPGRQHSAIIPLFDLAQRRVLDPRIADRDGAGQRRVAHLVVSGDRCLVCLEGRQSTPLDRI